MPGSSSAEQSRGMEPTNLIYRQAEMAYRTSYLTEQLTRPGARAHHAQPRSHRRSARLHWWTRTTPSD